MLREAASLLFEGTPGEGDVKTASASAGSEQCAWVTINVFSALPRAASSFEVIVASSYGVWCMGEVSQTQIYKATSVLQKTQEVRYEVLYIKQGLPKPDVKDGISFIPMGLVCAVSVI